MKNNGKTTQEQIYFMEKPEKISVDKCASGKCLKNGRLMFGTE